MLTELAVSQLGVIAELTLVLGPGMTAITGETGAGKTLVVEAIELLLGGRADALLVRPGADEARVDGRFVVGDDEVVLTRVVPRQGRSRAYVDGHPATVAALTERGRSLVDLHGQHAHQSLLSPPAQRNALDRFGGVDLAPLVSARRELAEVEARLVALGGDERVRAREIDLLRFQVGELDAAAIEGADEEDHLEAEEDRLADAGAHRAGAARAAEALLGDDGAGDRLGVALAAVQGRPPLAEHEARLRTLWAELDDVGAELRTAAERLEDDPERLEAVRARRNLLRELRRKYGATLDEVLAYADDARRRLVDLEGHAERASLLERERDRRRAAVGEAAAAVGERRRRCAPALAAAVTARLGELAMARAELGVEVGEGAGDDVTLLLRANAGEAVLPLARVASGGELARTMLALRLVLGGAADGDDAPSTLVFDEVDAGIGGHAALAVGRSLAALAGDHQVLVVTHLPQVAAFADTQVAVAKHERDGRTVATASVLDGAARVAELSRMLSGLPDSDSGRHHAAELLEEAAEQRRERARPRRRAG